MDIPIILCLAVSLLSTQVNAYKIYNGNPSDKRIVDSLPSDSGVPHLYPTGMCFGPGVMNTGSRQSPINLQRRFLSKFPNCDNVGEVQDFMQDSQALLINTGDTVDFELLQSSPSFEIGTIDVKYKLERMHYHWGGSEHLLDGKEFAGEFHMVFYNTMYPNFDSAANCTNGIMVVANWLQVSTTDNPMLEPFIRGLSKIPFQNDSANLHEKINLRQLMPKCITKYFSYFGGLTTEPFNEVVKWVVFRDPVPISKYQLDQFKGLHTGGPGSPRIKRNVREVQAINGRLVLTTEHCKCHA